ncbi:hypothetical protein [Pseudoalteromonas luteoviolacea]|uniref:N-acetyltransferase domain-containing protein n=1 Tax=Pseudoalteromonas luteoviolacea NCIMB 1942 TaxID=1365253 RepID=A0A166ZKA0_9GAMM|nr:hypothetical protein [Pseudoalteromonas luteoviolacea]KZN44400.1 hypothetical protein N482_16350 [Pseudoalteromonas luteoviolacea NCIMB 1942]
MTEEGVDAELQLVESGSAHATVSIYQNQIVGLAILISGVDAPSYIEKYARAAEASFIGDVVVSKKHSGMGGCLSTTQGVYTQSKVFKLEVCLD